MAGDVAAYEAAKNGGHHHKWQYAHINVAKLCGDTHGDDVWQLSTEDDAQRGKNGGLAGQREHDDEQGPIE